MASDTHAPQSHGHGEGHAPSFNLYIVIFVALSIFTALSFVFNEMVRSGNMTNTNGFLAILGVACIKATLVGMYFMHLKFDWGRLFFVIIPVSIMAVLLLVVLLPDIVLAWHIEPPTP